MKPKQSSIDKLITIFGTSSAAARAVGVDRRHFANWKGQGYIPARWAAKVQQITKGKVKAVDVVSECGNRA